MDNVLRYPWPLKQVGINVVGTTLKKRISCILLHLEVARAIRPHSTKRGLWTWTNSFSGGRKGGVIMTHFINWKEALWPTNRRKIWQLRWKSFFGSKSGFPSWAFRLLWKLGSLQLFHSCHLLRCHQEQGRGGHTLSGSQISTQTEAIIGVIFSTLLDFPPSATYKDKHSQCDDCFFWLCWVLVMARGIFYLCCSVQNLFLVAVHRIAGRDKKAFLSDQCKEIEENDRMGKTKDLFKKTRDTKGKISCKDGHNKGQTWYGPNRSRRY